MSNLFVFEGPDEVGKTTVVSALIKELNLLGKKCIQLSFPGKEANTLGDHIYKLHHDPSLYSIDNMTPLSLQILHVAAHADMVERKILPLLKNNTIILLDRYWWSTWVYGITSGIPLNNMQALIDLEKSFWENIFPSVLFLFSRSESKSSDRLKKVYAELAASENNKYPIINYENNNTVSHAVSVILPKILDMLETI